MLEIILSPEQMWQAALAELQLQLSKAIFDDILRNTILVCHNVDTNEFVVDVGNDDIKTWLERRMLSTLRRTLTGISGRSANIQLKVINSHVKAAAENPILQDSESRLLVEWGALGVPLRFETETLESLDWAQPALQKPEMRKYVEQSLAHFIGGVGLTLIGPTGVGKTHIAVGLLKKAVMAGLSAYFIGTVALLDGIRATFASTGQDYSRRSERRMLKYLTQTDVLVLDDLRVDGLTTWGRDRLYAVLNPRWERGLPTISTSNYTPGELASPPGRERIGMDEGTLSRLVRANLTIKLDGEDFRPEQKRRAIASVQSQSKNPDNSIVKKSNGDSYDRK